MTIQTASTVVYVIVKHIWRRVTEMGENQPLVYAGAALLPRKKLPAREKRECQESGVDLWRESLYASQIEVEQEV